MHDLWERFEAWLSREFPGGLAALRGPADPREVAALEERIGVVVPDDFRASLLRHDGQDPLAAGLVHTRELLSVARMLDEWRTWNDLLVSGELAGLRGAPATGVRDAWWDAAWIAACERGDMVYSARFDAIVAKARR